jgi:glycosyltransferase involved in cell wall biosynthesis
LVGHNSVGHDLGALAARFGLGRDLVHREYADHEALIDLYNAADLFVYPSSYEGFGIPVVEAMACGVPTITPRNSALSEFARGVHFCEDGTADELYRAMRAVMTSPQLRATLSREGRERAQDYLWGGIARRTLDTLARVAIGAQR